MSRGLIFFLHHVSPFMFEILFGSPFNNFQLKCVHVCVLKVKLFFANQCQYRPSTNDTKCHVSLRDHSASMRKRFARRVVFWCCVGRLPVHLFYFRAGWLCFKMFVLFTQTLFAEYVFAAKVTFFILLAPSQVLLASTHGILVWWLCCSMLVHVCWVQHMRHSSSCALHSPICCPGVLLHVDSLCCVWWPASLSISDILTDCSHRWSKERDIGSRHWGWQWFRRLPLGSQNCHGACPAKVCLIQCARMHRQAPWGKMGFLGNAWRVLCIHYGSHYSWTASRASRRQQTRRPYRTPLLPGRYFCYLYGVSFLFWMFGIQKWLVVMFVGICLFQCLRNRCLRFVGHRLCILLCNIDPIFG